LAICHWPIEELSLVLPIPQDDLVPKRGLRRRRFGCSVQYPFREGVTISC
jgi:hypothetical protein